MATLKKYKKLPVHVVEDHNDALHHILRGIGSKHAPFDNNLMIHFDSHPDLLIPSELDSSLIFEPNLLLEQLSIENWILPAAFAGHISTIVWIKPYWSNQIDDGHYKFKIGRMKGTTKIRVNSTLLYFVSEMLFCDEKNLEDTKDIELYIYTQDPNKDNDIGEKLIEIIDRHSGEYLLDIDLDFFSTINPFMEMHKNVDMYEKLKNIYKFKFTETNDSQIIENLQSNRIKQISHLKEIFEMLTTDCENALDLNVMCNNIDDKNIKMELVDLILALKKEYKENIDWGLIHDAGCTCDDEERILPHHISSNTEITNLMQGMEGLLTSLPRPILVTIARSSLDDYCPPNIVDSLQQRMFTILRKLYDVELKLHYQTD